MDFEKWMGCEIFMSDGTWTIGYVDGEPAQWDGDMEMLEEGGYFDVMGEGSTFGVNITDEYIVEDGVWVVAYVDPFPTLADAKTFVGNSGVIDWEWYSDEYSNEEIVNDLLPGYLYYNMATLDDFDDVLKSFIEDVLHQNSADYGY